MLSKIISKGLIILVLFVVFVSGCISLDEGVNETASDGAIHFEGKGISFNAPNTWQSIIKKNQSDGYLFSIQRITGLNTDWIVFYAGYWNGTLSEYYGPYKKELQNSTWTYSEKELIVNGLPGYQIATVNDEKRLMVETSFIKNGVIYRIISLPADNNLTSIEPDLKMVISTFQTT